MSDLTNKNVEDSSRRVSTFIGAVKVGDIELISEFLPDHDFLEKNVALVAVDVVKNKDIYRLLMSVGMEDSIFSNLNSSKINEITLDVMKSRNFYALDFIINNANELDFDINATIKNRGYMEIALFFNSPESVELLLINEIDINKKMSIACESWISDNFMFLENPMHSHFKNKNWRSDFIQILAILKESGWTSISKISSSLLNANSSKIIKSVRRVTSVREIDYDRVIMLLNKLDKETLYMIKESLDV